MLTAILRLFSGMHSVKGKIWVIYQKFRGKLRVIYGNGNIPNLTGNFRTLMHSGKMYKTAVKRPI